MESNDDRADPPKWCTGSRDNTLIASLMEETERGQVLVGTAFLDKLLEECLSARFKREGAAKDLRDRLLKDDRSLLGSLGAKTMACRAFGVIGKKEYIALEVVRKIRNMFAHSDFKITMDDSEVSKLIEPLREYLKENDALWVCEDDAGSRTSWWRAPLKGVAGVVPSDPPSRQHVFLGVVISLSLYLGIVRQTESGAGGDGQLAI